MKVEHTTKEEQTGNSSMLRKTKSSWFALLVHSETKPPERKRRKVLCAEGVNCRYSVPNLKKKRKKKQEAQSKVLFTHTCA